MTTYFISRRSILLLVFSMTLFSCHYDADDHADYKPIFLSDTDPNNPYPFEGSLDPLERIPYSEIPNSKYIIELERWDIPNNRTDPIRTTDNLQSAIDWAVGEGYGEICLPEGHYLIGKEGNDIYYEGIELSSNMAFLLDKNAIIEMNPNNKWNYCVIRINNKAFVVISGGTILGDRVNHEYTPRNSDGSTAHDEGHLICVEGASKFVTIENMVLGSANGDGVLLVGSDVGEEQMLEDVVINHNNFSDNRRQGISIVGGSNILIENNEIHHTQGTSPEFGIDLEGAGRINENIRIRTNYFHHNRGGDVVNTDGSDVFIENNTLLQGKTSTYIDGPLVYWKNASWTIRNNNITMRTVSANNWNGIIMYSNDHVKTNQDTTFIYNNTLNNCGMYMYKGADLSIKNNNLNNGHLAFWKMENLILETNIVEHDNKCWAYRFLEVSGNAEGNIYNGESFEIPLQPNVSYDGCWIN